MLKINVINSIRKQLDMLQSITSFPSIKQPLVDKFITDQIIVFSQQLDKVINMATEMRAQELYDQNYPHEKGNNNTDDLKDSINAELIESDDEPMIKPMPVNTLKISKDSQKEILIDNIMQERINNKLLPPAQKLSKGQRYRRNKQLRKQLAKIIEEDNK